MTDDEPTVEEFVLWLERRGATFSFRRMGLTIGTPIWTACQT